MANDKNSSSGGIGFCGLLTIAFIVLKLCNVINWSWWWVLSPLWLIAFLVILVLAITATVEVNKEEKEEKVYKSKWQERFEEMKKKQEELKNKN
jgi:nitrate/nitrite transporter NarK